MEQHHSQQRWVVVRDPLFYLIDAPRKRLAEEALEEEQVAHKKNKINVEEESRPETDDEDTLVNDDGVNEVTEETSTSFAKAFRKRRGEEEPSPSSSDEDGEAAAAVCFQEISNQFVVLDSRPRREETEELEKHLHDEHDPFLGCRSAETVKTLGELVKEYGPDKRIACFSLAHFI